MSALSGILVLLFLAEIFHILVETRFTLFDLFCNQSGVFSRGRLIFYYFINYIFKYIELADTFFLLLRGKPVTFLHGYHHAATLALAFSQLLSQTCIQWIVIMINLAIHVFMYAYYACTELHIRFAYKEWLTKAQVIQFLIDVIVCVYTCILRFIWTFWPHSKFGAKCHGTWSGSFTGLVILTSYFVLFLQFYKTSYMNPNNPQKQYSQKRYL